MVNCTGVQFDPYDIWGYSVENEIIINNNNCLSNLLKVCTFSIYLIISGIMLIVSIFGIIRELREIEQKKGHKWNYNTRNLVTVIFFSSVSVCFFALFLSGSFHRGKYALFPFGLSCFMILGYLAQRDWYLAYQMIRFAGGKLTPTMMWWMNFRVFSLAITTFVGFEVLWMILPMIFFEDPWKLNWAMAIGYTFQGVITVITGIQMIYDSNTLLKKLKHIEVTENTDKKVGVFRRKLETSFQTTIVTWVISAGMFAPIIWIGVTQTSTDPGLANLFYFEFFYCVPLRMMVSLATIQVAFYKEESIFMSSDNDVENKEMKEVQQIESNGKSPAHSMEGLNGSLKE